MTQPPSRKELLDQILLIPPGELTDVDKLVSIVVAQTGWDFEHTKAVFLANFRTELK